MWDQLILGLWYSTSVFRKMNDGKNLLVLIRVKAFSLIP